MGEPSLVGVVMSKQQFIVINLLRSEKTLKYIENIFKLSTKKKFFLNIQYIFEA